MSETPFTPQSTNPNELKTTLSELIARVFVVLETYLIPPPPAHTDYIDFGPVFGQPGTIARENAATGRPFMALCHAEQFLTHIRRVEYCLRAFILHLAVRFLTEGEALPADGNDRHSADIARATSPDTPTRPSSFTLLSGPTASRRHGRTSRYKKLIISTWTEVDISQLIARLKRLPAVIKSADARAKALAARLRRGELETSAEAAHSPRITMLTDQPQTRAYLPGFFRQLEVWHPPPSLYEHAFETERDALNRLHLLAGAALSACAKKH